MGTNEILLTVMTTGFGVNFALMYIIWASINNRLEKIEAQVLDIDRRLCRIEGAMSAKDCCMLKDDSKMPKAQ